MDKGEVGSESRTDSGLTGSILLGPGSFCPVFLPARKLDFPVQRFLCPSETGLQ
jgi:hypothetical protein